MASGVITTTETDSLALERIALMIQTYLSENAVLIPTIMDRTSDVQKGDKSVSYNRRGGLTAETKTSGSDYNSQKFTYTADKLLLTTREGVYVEMEGEAELHSVIEQEPHILDASIDALAQSLEAKVFTALIDVSTSSPDHAVSFDTSDTISLADIANARRLLNKQFVPKTDRFLAVNSDQETDILNLDNFLHAEKYGSNMPLMNGEIGRIMGFRVLVTENVTESKAVAYHRSHVVFGRQQAITWEQDRELRADKFQYLLQTHYGLKTLDSGKRGVLMENPA